MSHSFSPFETNVLAYLFLPSSSRRRVGCDRWRLHWGHVRGLSHLISVQCFIVTSSLFMFPFLFYFLFCAYLCMNFAMLLCLVCVCLSITTVQIAVPDDVIGSVYGENGSNLARLRQVRNLG